MVAENFYLLAIIIFEADAWALQLEEQVDFHERQLLIYIVKEIEIERHQDKY